MSQKITERDKLFLIGGGVFVVLYSLYVFVAAPLYSKHMGSEQKIQDKISFIEKYYAVLNQKPLYEKKDQSNREVHAKLAGRFFHETRPALVAADLQKLLEEVARESNISIERVRIDKPKYTEQLLTIPVEITVRSSLKNLSGLIYRIESHEKFLVIEELDSRRFMTKTEPEELQTRLLVSGFIQQLETENGKTI